MFSNKTSAYLDDDNARIDALLETHPRSLSVNDISNFLGMDVSSVRAAIENDVFGISWKKIGSARHGYFIPTAQFVRWYLSIN